MEKKRGAPSLFLCYLMNISLTKIYFYDVLLCFSFHLCSKSFIIKVRIDKRTNRSFISNLLNVKGSLGTVLKEVINFE